MQVPFPTRKKMARTIKHYLKSHPTPKRKPGRKVATAEKIVSVGWAWKPDDETRKALSRGNRKVKRAKAERQSIIEDSKMATRKSKKASKKGTAKRKAAAKKKASSLIPLKKLLGNSYTPETAKMARRKLRASKEMSKIHDQKGRWEFTQVQAKKAKEVLAA